MVLCTSIEIISMQNQLLPNECHPDLMHCIAAHQIAQRAYILADVINLMGKHQITKEDLLQPYENQTKRGIFLEIDYNSISLWLPWGKWIFIKNESNLSNEFIKQFIELINPQFFYETKKNLDGFKSNAKIYKVAKLDEVALPEPITKEQAEYFTPEKCVTAWKTLKTFYENRYLSNRQKKSR